jgi:hypothetical protein
VLTPFLAEHLSADPSQNLERAGEIIRIVIVRLAASTVLVPLPGIADQVMVSVFVLAYVIGTLKRVWK